MYSSDKRPVTMKVIADKLGVSAMAVSLALKNSPRVSQKKRIAIRDLARELNYRPDPILGQLASYRKSSRATPVKSAIAWINDWEKPDQFFNQVEFRKYYEGACDTAEKLGYNIEVFNTRENGLTQSRFVSMLEARGVQGIIVPPHPTLYEIPNNAWEGFAVVRIGFNNPTARNHIVCSDQFEGGRIAAKQMLEAGYKRIGYIGNRNKEIRARYNFSAGFESICNVMVPEKQRVPSLIFDSRESSDNCKYFLEWLRKYNVDATFNSHGKVDGWIRDIGLEIGKDIGMAGVSINDSVFDSGLDQRPFEIGAVALQFLSQLIMYHKLGLPDVSQRIMISPTWVNGSSLSREGSL